MRSTTEPDTARHSRSPRRKGPKMTVHCRTITVGLNTRNPAECVAECDRIVTITKGTVSCGKLVGSLGSCDSPRVDLIQRHNK